MTLAGFSRALSRAPSAADALANSARSEGFSVIEGLRAPLIASLLEQRSTAAGLLAITPTGREVPAFADALRSFLPAAQVVEFPAWETLPHERLSPSTETVGRRLAALHALGRWRDAERASGGAPEGAPGDREGHFVLVASVRAALQPLAPGLDRLAPIVLEQGGRGNDLTAISAQLADQAYTRVDMVTRRGEFAVRGGILDVFPPTAEHPYRVDFFGDEVDELRMFSVADQRSLDEPVDRIELLPGRELLLTDAVRGRAREMLHEFPGLAPMLEKLAEGIPVDGMESIAPALLPELVPIVDYLPADAAIAVLGPERIARRAADLADTNREFLAAAWSAATVGAAAPIDLDAGDFLSLGDLRRAAAGRTWWTFTPFTAAPPPDHPAHPHREPAQRAVGAADSQQVAPVRGDDDGDDDGGDAGDDAPIHIDARAVPSFSGEAAGAIEHIKGLIDDGWRVVVAAAGSGLVERAVDVLADAGIGATTTDAVLADFGANGASVVPAARGERAPGAPSARGERAPVEVTRASVEAGVELPDVKLALIGEAEFYGRAVGVDSRRPKKLASRRRNVVDPLQLKAGDYVVHETHGIGRFVELTTREVSTGGRHPVKHTREYLVIEYAPSKRGFPGDRLSVPTDQLDLLTRYVGGEEPSLSKMGGSDWSAAKGRARKAVRDIAVELVKLYSARQAAKGYAFSPDTPWQREFEDAFPFAETPDQLTTIDEVKRDMERPIPMDRLLAGDVGYGKTEVAVRAAFKAVQDGKQVAVLVPTTLLVRQHLETFAERFAGFPIHLRGMSRFNSDKEIAETVQGLADGTVDVVIGTHRLLAQHVAFKDLGLVVIDEEQRFGVEHKDQLKQLKTNVDVLAMSATPIPRTLEMAVTGIREMSTLATPPEDRHPILTFVGPWGEKQVQAAIRRELLREGQVFYVHNRVSSINRVAAQLAELVPEARIAVAHGQLPEGVLEQVMVDFWERRFDVLVSTTIIETGLDIANANTLIIDRADKFGLSQLHQLRGRVGRGRERAYAYFLYDPEKPLSETAHDRLSTIAANNELGGGMQIALKDLEIRGAGNLLGAEQAGHIQGVGFDLYLRMIGEAVSTFRGDVAEGQTELRLELPVDARIPEEYVDSERLRLEAYQKLSVAASPTAAEDALDRVLEELIDRYGQAPEAVTRLVEISRLRRLAQQFGLSDVVVMGTVLRVAPADLPDSRELRLKRLYPGAKLLKPANAVTVPLPSATGERVADDDLIAWVRQLLEAIFEPAATADAGQRAPVAMP